MTNELSQTPARSKIAKLWLVLLAVAAPLRWPWVITSRTSGISSKNKHAISTDADKAKLAGVCSEVYRQLEAARWVRGSKLDLG